MALQKLGGNPQNSLLDGVGIGDHPPEEPIRCPRHRRQGGPNPTAGAALGHGQGLAPLAQEG